VTRLLVIDIAQNAGRDLSVERSVLGTDVRITQLAYAGDAVSLVNACQSADVILTDYVPFTRDVIRSLRRCRLISVAATGFSCVDVKAAADHAISVCAVGEYCTEEVADHTLALMLALTRRLIDYHVQVQKDRLWQFDTLSGLRRMSELTLGIVGCGRIGQAVARRALGFGMQVIASDPFVDAGLAAESGVTLCSLNELLEKADVISLHCALTEDNRHLLDADAFTRMQRKPVLINVARGELIDEAALLAALDEGRIAAAGLDVLESESPKLHTSGLVGRENVILTPHVAFYSDTSMLENRRISAANIRHFLDGNHAAVRKYIHHAQRG
jgi:D-3-phosphoglycerate dehydrogenase